MSISREEFDGAFFGDKRLNSRYIKIVEKLRWSPSLSFPKQMDRWADLKGLYRFFDNNKVTYKEILFPHICNVRKRCFEEEVVLVVQDTTFLNFSLHPCVKGMGYIGNHGNFIGMLVHNAYGVSGKDKKPLGLINQQIIVRNGIVKKEETNRERLSRKRESEKWEKGLIASNELLKDHKKIIQVADREADIYVFIKKILELGQSFVIRCDNKHRLTEQGHIYDEIEKSNIVGRTEIRIQRNGKRKRRTAIVEIKSCSVNIIAPKIINRKGENLPINIVIAEEINTPVATDRLSWILLTGEPIDTFQDCMKVIGYYQSRWLIEEFHKGLKTGCKIEDRQLQSREKLEKLLGVFSITVYQLLLLRYFSKNPDSTEIILPPLQMFVLQKQFPKESCDLSPKGVLTLVAKLGGFIGRKSDGSPGWITLMRGMHDLYLMEQGVLLSAEYADFVGKG